MAMCLLMVATVSTGSYLYFEFASNVHNFAVDNLPVIELFSLHRFLLTGNRFL